jgi:hypothetical protein
MVTFLSLTLPSFQLIRTACSIEDRRKGSVQNGKMYGFDRLTMTFFLYSNEEGFVTLSLSNG